jgi:ABC-type antimicrobial peptide transport system permease subunit
VIQPRGTLSTRRVTAHWVVLAAAALTTLVAAAVGAALAVFAGQALPLAVRHDLSVAPGSTALSIAGPVSNDRAAATASTLRTAVRQSLGGVPFGFWSGTWSDPLDLVPGSLPTRPASAGKGNAPLLEAAALDGITSHAVLVSGQWPAAPAASQEPRTQSARAPAVSDEIPAALPASAAALLHLSPGDVLALTDGISHARLSFRITGLFAPRRLSGTGASYWALSTIPASGSSAQSGYTMYGPLLVSPAAFTPAPSSTGSGTGGTLTASTGTWLAQPDMAKFTDSGLPAISGNVSVKVSALQQALLTSSVLGGMQLSTHLPSVLSAAASNLSVARSLLVISALQLLVLAVAVLLAVARLLASQREGETALLSARGATRWQLARLTAAEVIPLCTVAAVVGAAGGMRLAALLTTTGPLKAAGVKLPGPAFLVGGGGTVSPAGTWLDVIAAALVVTVIAVAAMLGPVLAAVSAMAEARVRRGRQAAIAGATRAGADIALIGLAVLAGWQLRRYSALSGPDTTIDPVLAVAPALALAGGTVVTLRLLPAAARAGDRLAGRGRRLTTSLAGWQVSRQPLRQGGAALLLVMAVATGTLALAQHASWNRSASDQGSFAAGADARVDTPSALTPGATGAITNAAGVRHAMAVYVQPDAAPAEVLAIDAAQAPDTVQIRPDQVGVSAARLFGEITPKSAPGTPIPGRPDTITFTAALAPTGIPAHPGGVLPISTGQASAIARELGPVAVTVTVADATGDIYQLDAGTLPADGREHVLAASLGGADVGYPLRLVQIALAYQMPPAKVAVLALTVTGPSLAGWQASATSPDLQGVQQQDVTLGSSALPSNGTWRAKGDTATFTLKSGFGQASSPSPPPTSEPVDAQVTLNAPSGRAMAPLPAIATSAFADANNVGTGSVVQAALNGLRVPLSIVAVVKSFPTVTASTGALIVDLPAIQQRVVSQGAPPVFVTQWWLATADHQIPRGLSGALPPGSAVTGAAEATAELTGDPLSAAPQQALLALAAAAALLAITGFWVSIAANVRQRRAENALLAALGVSQRSAALQLFLEKLLLSVPSAVLGVVLGTVVARLLVPAITLTTAATQPVPPPVTLFDLPQTLSLAAAVAILPALATALIMIRRPDPAAELRAAEAA